MIPPSDPQGASSLGFGSLCITVFIFQKGLSSWIALYLPHYTCYVGECALSTLWSKIHSLLYLEIHPNVKIIVYSCHSASAPPSPMETLSAATKALQEGRKSLNFILLHSLLPRKLVGVNVQFCSYLIPTPPLYRLPHSPK